MDRSSQQLTLADLKPSLAQPPVSSSVLPTSGSLHGSSSEDMSETSDYQRSTPSPRDQDDDDLFVVRKKRNFQEDLVECDSTKDLGFVDTIVKLKKKQKYKFFEPRTSCTAASLSTMTDPLKTSNPLNSSSTKNLTKPNLSTPTKLAQNRMTSSKSSKCSFSPKSFYKSNDLKPDLNHHNNKNNTKRSHNSNDEKCSEPPIKMVRSRPEPVVQIPFKKADQKRPKKVEQNFVKKLLENDPKLATKAALVKISKLPLDAKLKNKSFRKKSNNSEAVNSIVDIMTQARVSPVKAEKSPEGSGIGYSSSKPVWPAFGSSSKTVQALTFSSCVAQASSTPATSSTSPTMTSTSASPSKILRPSVLNVLTPPKVEVKQEPLSTNFTTSASSLTSSTTTSSSLTSNNNPFLPTDTFKKTPFLFGRDSDFQSANVYDADDVDDNVIIYVGDDEDEDDDDSTNDSDVNLTSNGGVKASEHIFGTGLFSGNDSKDELRSFLFNTFAAINNSEPKSISETLTRSAPEPTCNKIRFPSVQGTSNLIRCKWKSCDACFTAYGKLSDHLKAAHVIDQLKKHQPDSAKSELEGAYCCLWDGCKVYGMVSSSRSWLEKHVPTHCGKFAFACIVSDCKMRFSSQKLLQRHVNQHFAPVEKSDHGKKSLNASASYDPYHNLISRKKVEQTSESSKNLRRAGVKLKFRRCVFSARNFDFFDVGIMAGLKHALVNSETEADARFGLRNDCIRFRSKVLASRKTLKGDTEVNVQWFPENLLPNEWISLSSYRSQSQKEIPFSDLPHSAKLHVSRTLLATNAAANHDNSSTHSGRKNRVRRSQQLPCPMPLPPKGLF